MFYFGLTGKMEKAFGEHVSVELDSSNQILKIHSKNNSTKALVDNIDFNYIKCKKSVNTIIFDNIDFAVESESIFLMFIALSEEYLKSSFKNPLDINNEKINIKQNLKFKNCNINLDCSKDIPTLVFNGNIEFDECFFVNSILKLKNIQFKQNISIELNKSICKLEFNKVEFTKYPNFKKEKAKANLIFKNIDFNFSILLYKHNANLFQNIIFDNVKFNEELVFSNGEEIKYYSEFYFLNAVFTKSLDLKYVHFNTLIHFYNVDFLSVVYFYSENFFNKTDFVGCKFQKYVKFEGIDYSDVDINIERTDFFDNVGFYQTVEDEKSKTIKKVNSNIKSLKISQSYFYKSCEISMCILNENSAFMYNIINEDLIFYNFSSKGKFVCSFNSVKGSADFSFSKFFNTISFANTKFFNFVNFYQAYFTSIPFFGTSSFQSGTNIKATYAKLSCDIQDIDNEIISDLQTIQNTSKVNLAREKRETFRLFKNNLNNDDNYLESLEYRVLELYAKELELDYKLKNKEEKITIKEQFDRWFLKLNRITSDHHTDFLKILLFTLSVIGGYFMINFGLSFDEKIISSIYSFVDLGLAIYGVSVVIFLLCLGYEFLFVLKGFSKDKGWLIFIFLAICLFGLRLAYSFNVSEFSVVLPMIFIGILAMLFILLANNIKYTFVSFVAAGFIGILCTPNIITPFLGAFSEDARNHYLYKAIDELDSQKALDLSRQILAKEPTSELNAKKTLKDYKDELKSSKLLEKSPELKRAVAIDGGVSRLNIAYYLVLAFCIFALQKTMRKNSIIPS